MERIHHQVRIVGEQAAVIRKRNQSAYTERPFFELYRIADGYFIVACIKPVNRDFVIRFGKLSFHQAGDVDFVLQLKRT